MPESVTVPSFAPDLHLQQIEQTGFRAAEPWGRWLLGQRATLSFNSPESQRIELAFQAYLPYSKQRIALSVNGKTIVSALRPSDPVGRLAGRYPIQLTAGRNTLEITTNKSNLDGVDPPFAGDDRSDISVALNTLELMPLQLRGNGVYGPRPSGFLNPVYASAGSQGLSVLFGPESRQIVSYSLLRRFEHQAFKLSLDGQPIHTVDAASPGHLLVGHFPLPSAPLPPSGLHSLQVTAQIPGQRPDAPSRAISTTAGDNSDVWFYVQKLELRNIDTSSASPAFFVTALLLGTLLVGLLWWWLFRSQRHES